MEEKNDKQTESILEQLQVLKEKKLVRAKTIFEIIENLERVIITRDNYVKHVEIVQVGFKTANLIHDIQQLYTKLQNPAFINNLTALNLTENLVINQNARHVVQSASFNGQEKREPGI